MSDCTVIIFAKTPLPGCAKTRLIPALGADGAAKLAAHMLRHALQAAVAAEIGPVEICCTPDITNHVFDTLAQSHAVTLTLQGEGDLGMRMHRAFERVLRKAPYAILMGTDAPGLDAATLQQVAHRLSTVPVVLVPAADGGYVLIGLHEPTPQLFTDIAWSTPSVMESTRHHLRLLSMRWVELATVHDIDEPADLVHLPKEWCE